MSKLEGYEYYRKSLNSAKYVVAPMVDASELAFRMQCRKHGAQLCYTPMFNAGLFVKSEHYRQENFTTCPEDRPLIVQFCANDPKIFLEACKLVQDRCDGVDLNLGCPQQIARRGHYGAFLQDEWELLEKMVSLCHKELKVPISCKIRIFKSLEKTIKYAKTLEKAGCQLLTVHGRTREQKGVLTDIANWKFIAEVRKNVKIPVLSNGNIQYFCDIERCINFTGVDGVMSAEGCLYNPALFEGKTYAAYFLAEEYLNFTKKYPCPLGYIRGHVFKILNPCLQCDIDEMRRARDLIAGAQAVDTFYEAVAIVKSTWLSYYRDSNLSNEALFPLKFVCQPYVRPPIRNNEEQKEESVKSGKPDRRDILKRKLEEKMKISEEDMNRLSLKKLKK
ncbi:DgyrCDS13805 [Dimorphilus gyrociliatus]|nr:DgyrCDS13805 [Dimorphilus gyrociliatus]